MALYFENLDERTRQLMLDEMEYDIEQHQLHISPFLSGQGQRDYENLLRDALQNGNDETLAQNLREHRRILRTLPRRNPSGGYSIAATAENAAQVLAESEFNRYYIRALARRAMEDGISELVIYRAKPVTNPRPELRNGRRYSFFGPRSLLKGSLDVFLLFKLLHFGMIVHLGYRPWVE